MGLHQSQNKKLAYFIENDPNSAKFVDITDSLGDPVMVEAHRLGSSSLRKTAVWTNASSHEFLAAHYHRNHKFGDKVPQFLSKQGFHN